MQVTELFKLQKHSVYLVRTEVINYYICIPENSYQKTNISIEIKTKMGNYNMDENDETWVLENVKNTYNYVDDYNITLVLPIMNESMQSILEKMDEEKFVLVDQVLAYIINSSFNLLTQHNIKVDNNVIMINNDRYKTFIMWFSSKYNGRVEVKNMLEVIHIFNVEATSYKKVETPLMNFVIGSYATEVDAPPKDIKPEIKTIKKTKPAYSGGFVSYYAIAILAIIVGVVVIILAF